MLTPMKTIRQAKKPIFYSQSYLESSIGFCDLCFALLDSKKEFFFLCQECDNFAACLACIKNPKQQLVSHSTDHLFYPDKPHSNTYWTNRNLTITCNICNQKHFFGKRYQCRQCFDYNVCSNCLENAKKIHYPSEKHIFDFILNTTKIHSNRYMLAERAKQVLRHGNGDFFDRDHITGWTMDEATIISEQSLNIFTAAWREASTILENEDIDSPSKIIENDKLIRPLVSIS